MWELHTKQIMMLHLLIILPISYQNSLTFIYSMFRFRTPSPSETQKNAFSRLCGVFNPSHKWEFPRRPCFPSVALTGRLNDTWRMTGNYLTIKREPRTIDPRKCDATKGRRTFAKRPGMIDDSLRLYLALVHNKHFSEKSRGRCVWLGSAPPAVTRALHNTWAPDQTNDPGSVVTFH